MNKIDNLLANGKKNLRKKLYADAIRNFKAYLERDSNSVNGLALLALGYNLNGDIENAITTSKRILELDPSNIEGMNNLFYAYDQSEKFEGAIQILKKYSEYYPIQINPGFSSEILRMFAGSALTRLPYTIPFSINSFFSKSKIGQSEKLIDALQVLLDKFPLNKYLLNELAKEYLHKEDLNKANEMLNIVLENYSNDPEALMSLGKLFALKNDYEKAINTFKKIFTLKIPIYDIIALMGIKSQTYHQEKYYALVSLELSNIYIQLGNYDEAILYSRKALMYHPKKPELWQNLGISYFQKGELNEAKLAYKRAFNLRNDDLYSLKQLAIIEYESKSYKKAIKAFQYFLLKKRDDWESWYYLAKSFFEKKNIKEAIKANSRCLNLNPQFEEGIEFQKTLLDYKQP